MKSERSFLLAETFFAVKKYQFERVSREQEAAHFEAHCRLELSRWREHGLSSAHLSYFFKDFFGGLFSPD